MQAKLQTSILSAGDYVTIGWQEFTKNIQKFLVFFLISNVPIALLGLLLPDLTSSEPDVLAEQIASSSGIIILYVLVSSILSLLVGLAVPNIIEQSIQDRDLMVPTALQQAFPRLLMSAVVTLLFLLVIVAAFLFFIIPGIWIGTLLQFVLYAVALRSRGLNAFSYSWSLVTGRWWAAYGRNILIGLIFSLIAVGLFIAVGIFGFIFNMVGLGIMAGLANLVVFSLFGYFGATVATIMFLNFDYTCTQSSKSSDI